MQAHRPVSASAEDARPHYPSASVPHRLSAPPRLPAHRRLAGPGRRGGYAQPRHEAARGPGRRHMLLHERDDQPALGPPGPIGAQYQAVRAAGGSGFGPPIWRRLPISVLPPKRPSMQKALRRAREPVLDLFYVSTNVSVRWAVGHGAFPFQSRLQNASTVPCRRSSYFSPVAAAMRFIQASSSSRPHHTRS